MELEDRSPLTRRLTASLTGSLIFEEREERIIKIIVWHVGSARQAFRRRHGIQGSLTAVEWAPTNDPESLLN